MSANPINRVTLKLAVACRFNVAVSRRGLSTQNPIVEKIMSEIAKWLQGLALCKLQGNNAFWKEKRSKRSFVTDQERLFNCFLVCSPISHLIGGYTIDTSKSKI